MSECVSTCSTAGYLTVFPLTHSVARELEAMAEPQPNVLNLASTIFPSSSTLIWGGGRREGEGEGGGGRREGEGEGGGGRIHITLTRVSLHISWSSQFVKKSDDFETEIDCYLH